MKVSIIGDQIIVSGKLSSVQGRCFSVERSQLLRFHCPVVEPDMFQDAVCLSSTKLELRKTLKETNRNYFLINAYILDTFPVIK